MYSADAVAMNNWGSTCSESISIHIDGSFTKLSSNLRTYILQSGWSTPLLIIVIEETDLARALVTVVACHCSVAVWVKARLKHSMRVLAQITFGAVSSVPAHG